MPSWGRECKGGVAAHRIGHGTGLGCTKRVKKAGKKSAIVEEMPFKEKKEKTRDQKTLQRKEDDRCQLGKKQVWLGCTKFIQLFWVKVWDCQVECFVSKKGNLEWGGCDA